MFIEDLKRLGLTEKEARLYMTSVRIGPASMQVLARRANIDRGTAYHVAKTLGEKSLFAQVTDGVRPLFRATPPREFHQRLERQHIELERQLIALQTVLVDLEELYAIGNLSKEAL